MKILIAEDKDEISSLVELFMQKEGFETAVAHDGQEALEYLLSNHVDLCVFDIMMPRLDGLSLIKQVRTFTNIPIILLTAKNLEQDKILGLDLGADDYITKPFSSLELVSRVKANLRRSYDFNVNEGISRYGDILIDRDKCKVYKNDKDCMLTAAEYKILLKLVSSPERVFTKAQLYKVISSEEYIDSDENTITVHISNIRDKIESNPKEPEYIKTIRGLGYKIEKKQTKRC